MKKISAWLLFLPVLLSAGEIDFANFYTSRDFWAAGGKIEVLQEPNSLSLEWQPEKRALMECNFQARPDLGTFEKIVFSCPILQSGKGKLNAVILRLIDAKGEVFNFPCYIKPTDKVLTYEIDAVNPRNFSTWATNPKFKADRKLDFPVKLLGVALIYPPKSAPGEIKLLGISYRKTPYEPEMILSREGKVVSLKDFAAKNSGKATVYTYPQGVLFPRLQGGQFRLGLEGSAKDIQSAELVFFRGNAEVKLTKTVAGKENELVFPVIYELDQSNVTLKRVTLTLKEGKTAVLKDIVYELLGVKFAFDIGKGSAINVWQEGSKGRVLFENTTLKPVSGEVALKLFCDQDKPVWELKKSVSLAPGGKLSVDLPKLSRFGLYRLSGTLPGKNNNSVAFSTRFAYMPENSPRPHDGMQYGIALLTHAIPRSDSGALGANMAGIDFVRSTPLWYLIEAHKDKWNWKYTDDYVAVIKKHGLRWAPIYWCPPRWVTAKDWKPSYTPVAASFGFPRPDYERWEIFVRNCTRRYGKDFRVIEIWNEAELPGFANFTPEEYAELLKRAYKVIKEEFPHIKVSTCGYTCLPGQHPRMTFPDFQPRSLKAARGFYDIHSIHFHNLFAEYVDNITEFLRLRKEEWKVTVPWAANETAVTASFVSRRAQAEVLFQKMIFTHTRDAGAYVWHNMIDLGRVHTNKEHNFGLLDNALQPKEALLAFNTVTNLFRGAKFLKEFSLADCYGYLFRRDNKFLVPFWTLYAPASNRLVVIGNIKGKAVKVDLYGNREELNVINGKTLFHVTESPATLELEQEEAPEFLGEFFKETGKPGEYQLTLKNSVRAVSGQQKGRAAHKVTVKNDRFSFRAVPMPKQKFIDFVLNFNTPWGEYAVRQYRTTSYTFPANADFNRPENFSMQDSSTFINTSPLDPTYADCVWNDAADCSAKVWVGLENGYFKVKTVVRDDIHFQNEKGTMIFRGDSMQYIISKTATGGMWKFGIARDDNGKLHSFCWMVPGKQDGGKMLKAIRYSIERNEAKKETTYNLALPAKLFGIQQGKPFRFNVLVNDNDGRCRVGYHSITEVLDDGSNDAGYPEIVFQNSKKK